jgi:hypothetical protein
MVGMQTGRDQRAEGAPRSPVVVTDVAPDAPLLADVHRGLLPIRARLIVLIVYTTPDTRDVESCSWPARL